MFSIDTRDVAFFTSAAEKGAFLRASRFTKVEKYEISKRS